jgi:hypothetical protein
MKTRRLTAASILACVLASTLRLFAQTILSGNISGTWSPSGNPYIISDNATVQADQTLTIQPGVVVWIGQGLNINVNGSGNIQAIGTASQPITIQAPISSQFWNQILLKNNTGTNWFQYCNFLNATNAISINNAPSLLGVMNCSFSNCVSSAIEVDPIL